MNVTNYIKKTRFWILLFGLVLSSLASSSAKEDMSVDKIQEFKSCLETKSQKSKGKICNAYVPINEEEISELHTCLRKENINSIDYDKDNSGNAFKKNVSYNCKSGKRFAVQFYKSDSSKEFNIAWVGEIVY